MRWPDREYAGDRKRFDVVVVGLGAVGSSACYELARRGVKVLGLEQFAIPNDAGSHHGDSRMIRLAYYEHPDYVPLLRRAYERWAELEETAGERLLFKTGGLYMGRTEPPGELVPESLRAAREHGLPHEVLDGDELRRRFPLFDLPEGYGGLWEPEAGLLLPERVIAAHVRLALEAGAAVHAHHAVTGLTVGSRGVTVDTYYGQVDADHVILAGGIWSKNLLEEIDLAIELRTTRQVVGWVWPRERPERFRLGELPVWAVESENAGRPSDPGRSPWGPDDREDPGGLWYGLPMLEGLSSRPGMKVGHHFPGPVVVPGNLGVRRPRSNDVVRLLPHVARYVPDAVGSLLGLSVCLYTLSPDGHFVLDRHPEHPQRLSYACGLSGHGFKLAPVLGEVLADWALEGTTELPVEFLGLRRLETWQTMTKPDGGSDGDAAAQQGTETVPDDSGVRL